MTSDRIIALEIQGLRCLGQIRIELDGLTVLIGDNGTGKSSIIEALEILRKAADQHFMEQFHEVHGGLSALLRHRSDRLRLGLWLDGPGGRIEYEFALARDGISTVVELEHLHLEPGVLGGPLPARGHQGEVLKVIQRTRSASAVTGEDGGKLMERRSAVGPGELLLASFGQHAPHPALSRVLRALQGIDVHLPFDVAAQWMQAEHRRQSSTRDDNVARSTDTLRRLGENLANAFHALKMSRSREHWEETLEMVRLGLGYDVLDVNTPATPDGGRITLEVVYRPDQPVSLFGLSDGTLAYLALVALFRLNTSKSLVAFDEPETHLHPALLLRTLDFWEEMSERLPVVLATHSDRLLDGLTAPERSVILCELDSERSTRLLRPDGEVLTRWLEDYSGLGDARSAGHQASFMTRPVE